MTLDEILKEWEKDCKIDQTELGSESTKIPELHNKYLKIRSMERLSLLQLQKKHDELYQLRCDWYMGKLSDEDLKIQKWEPNPLRVMADDLKYRMRADKLMADSSIRIAAQEEKINTLDSILNSINGRSFIINNAIKWLQFINGGR